MEFNHLFKASPVRAGCSVVWPAKYWIAPSWFHNLFGQPVPMWPPSWWKSFSLDLLGSACFLTCVHWHFSHSTPLTRTWLSLPCTLPVGSCIKQRDLPLFFSSSSLRLSWNRAHVLQVLYPPWQSSIGTVVHPHPSCSGQLCAGEPVTEHSIPHEVSKGPKRGGNHIPQPVGCTLTDTAQHMIGLLWGKGKLRTCSTCCPLGPLHLFL